MKAVREFLIALARVGYGTLIVLRDNRVGRQPAKSTSLAGAVRTILHTKNGRITGLNINIVQASFQKIGLSAHRTCEFETTGLSVTFYF